MIVARLLSLFFKPAAGYQNFSINFNFTHTMFTEQIHGLKLMSKLMGKCDLVKAATQTLMRISNNLVIFCFVLVKKP